MLGNSKSINGVDAHETQSIFALTILKKNQKNEINIFTRKCNSPIKDVEL